MAHISILSSLALTPSSFRTSSRKVSRRGTRDFDRGKVAQYIDIIMIKIDSIRFVLYIYIYIYVFCFSFSLLMFLLVSSNPCTDLDWSGKEMLYSR
ncbi:hypothetical protein OIU77_021869 [Salix suchowensis]|uniref:Uncharacterized protein n=1 Tax=Salix suchowensis TaxID=1278906 RepID=A0ABQ9CBF2_9ROSI|nr:hypothetical protein OIU77_021869 [Salix suchowensis]